MNSAEIENIDIKVYKNFWDKVGTVCKLKDFLGRLSYKNATYINILRQIKIEEEQKEYKKNMISCATLSCICNDVGKGVDNIIKRNNIIVLDIDKDDNKILKLDKEENLEYVKNWIFNLNFVYAVCKSCRGNGIFVVVPIEDGNKIEQYYLSLERFFKQHNIILDKACKNINRLRYISWDDKILIKEGEVEIWKEYVDLREEREINNFFEFKVKPKIEKIKNNEELFIEIYNCLLNNGYVLEDDYNYWIHESMNLHCLGDKGLELFKEVSRRSAGYKSDKDVENKWNATNKTIHVDDIIGEYINKAKKYIGENWKEKVNIIKANKY